MTTARLTVALDLRIGGIGWCFPSDGRAESESTVEPQKTCHFYVASPTCKKREVGVTVITEQHC